MPLIYRSIYTIIKIRPYIKYVHRILTKTIQTTSLHVFILHHANEHVPGKIQNLNQNYTTQQFCKYFGNWKYLMYIRSKINDNEKSFPRNQVVK